MTEAQARAYLADMRSSGTSDDAIIRILELALTPVGNLDISARRVYQEALDDLRGG